MSATPDLDILLARCLRREPAAQRALYLRYAGRMLGIARRYAYTVPEAEDILQDAFVKVFTHLGEYRAGGSLEGWIRRIVVTTAISHWRNGRLRHANEAPPLEEVPRSIVIDAVALEGLKVTEVLKLIERLPHGCRVVLLLYAVDGYSHGEISELLGIQESTSKAQLSKARKQLALLYKRQNDFIRL
ncbi:RNA polymerase sigma factor [Hymenobacter terrenus]|uniref:RNA polymerase sigma factor n=1 Tax=Hymenobacter terrenus TaxID=1629124 RepID=UPI000619E4FD|nr:RNA polymerase sigma factor [Hymenobacter terrenus]